VKGNSGVIRLAWQAGNAPIDPFLQHGELPTAKIVAGLVLSYYHRLQDVQPFAGYRHSIGFPGSPRYPVLTGGVSDLPAKGRLQWRPRTIS